MTKCADPRSASRHRSQAGFTLIEVLVSIMILSSVMIGMAGTATLGAREMRRSKEASMATILARETIDEMMTSGFDEVQAGTQTATVEAGNVTFYVTAVVAERGGVDGLKDVIVSVTNVAGRELERFHVSIQREWDGASASQIQ